MRKLLWIGDACYSSGFAKSTHYALQALRETYDISVLGLGYVGDAHEYQQLYKMYTCWPGGDMFGIGRIGQLAKDMDLVVVQNDLWNVKHYLDALRASGSKIPLVAGVPVDGGNCQGYKLNGAALTVFWTEFGRLAAEAGGHTAPAMVIPHGVELETYKPFPMAAARSILHVAPDSTNKLRSDSFIVLNVNRNQYRKRMDLTIEYFCEWVKSCKVENAILMLHTCPTGDEEYDLRQLMAYCGLPDNLVFVEPPIPHGFSEQQLMLEYNCADVVVTTTQGEGFGLTTLEAMACGKPVIYPYWAALPEVVGGAGVGVPCTSFAVTPTKGGSGHFINTIGGVADKHLFMAALQRVYTDHEFRQTLGEAARVRAEEEQFKWENVGARWVEALNRV